MDNDIVQVAEKLAGQLLQLKRKLVTAESCTGGGVAEVLTRLSGSSEWFERGFVTYSNDAKMSMLAVSHSILDDYGAVSEQTAAAMAHGALQNSLADCSVAITGIAGPGGGSEMKPIGRVCFAWAAYYVDGQTAVYGVLKNTVCKANTQQFDGDRLAVRKQACLFALQGLLTFLRH